MKETIVLMLSPQLKGILTDSQSDRLIIDDVVFENALKSDFIGFYDWLRSEEDKICGVRISPFDFAEQKFMQLPMISYLKILPDKALEIYFDSYNAIMKNCRVIRTLEMSKSIILKIRDML